MHFCLYAVSTLGGFVDGWELEWEWDVGGCGAVGCCCCWSIFFFFFLVFMYYRLVRSMVGCSGSSSGSNRDMEVR